MGRISLEGLEFHGYHGLYPEEQVNGNRFTVDIHIDTVFSDPVISDNLEGTIDYAAVYRIVKEEMDHRRGLLEALAIIISRRIRTTFQTADRVTVSISKHDPPIGGKCAKAMVTVSDPT